MPLVAYSKLPTFERLRQEGQIILDPHRALEQDIRELHIGLLNMMPDAALQATERQFFRLVGQSNQISQFYLHPFTLAELARGPEAREHVARHYTSFEEIQAVGLDGLIITGANVTQPDLALEPFWEPLNKVVEWAYASVTSTVCSCLATHAVLRFRYGQQRRLMAAKRWGVFRHRVVDRRHPLVNDVDTLFDVPHSRMNEVTRGQFREAGLHVLVEDEDDGVHLAVSDDRIRLVFLQGHPEYDMASLLKEYKREVRLYLDGGRADYPPYPENYLSSQAQAILTEHRRALATARARGEAADPFPKSLETLIEQGLHNTWHDTARSLIGKWVGVIYQITHQDRKKPFMDRVDPADPLKLRRFGR